MLRKRSGPMVSTTWPSDSRTSMVLRSVTTTPLTCGVHASVAIRIRNRGLPLRLRHGICRFLADFLPMEDRQVPVLAFDERGQALDPVAVVAVQNIADHLDFRFVDMTANNAVHAAPA